jgi:hypothetical protein
MLRLYLDDYCKSFVSDISINLLSIQFMALFSKPYVSTGAAIFL